MHERWLLLLLHLHLHLNRLLRLLLLVDRGVHVIMGPEEEDLPVNAVQGDDIDPSEPLLFVVVDDLFADVRLLEEKVF